MAINPASHLASEIIAVLKQRDEMALLPGVVKALEEEVLRNQDISVILATELSAAEQHSLTQTLQTKWGEHRVVFTVDSTILSGMIVRFQDTVLDLSGREAVHDLAKTLRN